MPGAPTFDASVPPLDLAKLFADLNDARSIVLAVSGGPDSTALMHLAAAWQQADRQPIWVATVDHGLRASSALEAEQVVERACRLGFNARALKWTGGKPTRGIQEAARIARYALLDAFAAEVGASHLVTAHTLDDQAETLLFRLSRGSGLAGLAGMRAVSRRSGLVHLRPLLNVRKQALVQLCTRGGWAFVQDPANSDPRFARARWRRMEPVLAAEGLTPERLGTLAARLARADAALSHSASEIAAACMIESTPEVRRFTAEALFKHADELVLRVLATTLTELTGGADHLRLNRLEALLAQLRAARSTGAAWRQTLHRCIVALDGRAELTIRPERRRRRGLSGRSLPLQSP